MRFLVTGGAGFIGSNFVEEALRAGHGITIIDNFGYAGGRDTIARFKDRVRVVDGDVCDRSPVESAMEGADWVIHFAAESHNTRAEHNPGIFYRTNVEGTQTVVKVASELNVAILHMSTDEVYGSRLYGAFHEEDKEHGDGMATSAYSKSKALADDWVHDSINQGDLPGLIVRCTNNFGPWQHPEKALPRWITHILQGKPIPLWGQGLQVRDWLYVKEHVRTLLGLIDGYAQLKHVVYNIAANNVPELTNRDIALGLCEVMDVEPGKFIKFDPDPRPNHDFRYALDTGRLQDAGFAPKPNIRSQLVETVAWYRESEAWWRARIAEAEALYV